MSGNVHYWTFDFPTDMVLRHANEFKNVPYNTSGSGPFDSTKVIRGEQTAGKDISRVFRNYNTVVKPLIEGKYISKKQLEIALHIITNHLNEKYYDCFSTTYDYINNTPLRPIIQMIGGLGVNVTKHIVTSGQTTTKKWYDLTSFFDIITFWLNHPQSYVPDSDVIRTIIDTNRLQEKQYKEIERLNNLSELSRDNFAQICDALMTPSADTTPYAHHHSAFTARPSALPSLWVEYRDNGIPYFHNTQTKETRWDRPIESHFSDQVATQYVPNFRGGKRTRKYKYKKRNRSKYRVGLSKRSNI